MNKKKYKRKKERPNEDMGLKVDLFRVYMKSLISLAKLARHIEEVDLAIFKNELSKCRTGA